MKRNTGFDPTTKTIEKLIPGYSSVAKPNWFNL